ncbi:MAG: hypothetical protein HKP10_04490 [Kiritimatiellales bacterium]|nr:hypothetical protein [Pontiella sp.]NNJ70529.1 hypothetical protein [Kiritimatiellales bacterium]
MHKMRPQMGYLIAALVILALGLVYFHEGRRDPGNLPAHDRATLVLAICIVLSGLLAIVATGRMWFRHLWHDRYKKSLWQWK